MINYNSLYTKYIDNKTTISYANMQKGKFYMLKEYKYADSHKETYRDIDAPIIYTLFVSKSKNIVHAVKVSNVKPNLIKKFFGKFVNEKHTDISLPTKPKQFYEGVVTKIPYITNDAYRTYTLNGIKKIFLLKIEDEGIFYKKTIDEIKKDK